MSIFSEKLNAIIIRKRISLPELSQHSGLTTALISKIKTGKRLPDSEEKIFSLIQALHCTLEQERDLLNEYRIEKFGRDNYLCMMECHRCIEMLVSYPSVPVFKQNSLHLSHMEQQCIVGEVNITKMVHNIINFETEHSDECVRIALQPSAQFDGRYLLDILAACKPDFRVEQIVPLYDTSLVSKDNVRFAAQCFRLAHYYGDKYQSFYYYKSDFAAAFFPFCILTSHHALLINMEYHSALYFNDAETLNTLHKMFDALLRRCHTLIKMNGTTNSYLKYYEQVFNDLKGAPLHTLQLSYAPSLIAIIPQHISATHIHPSLAGNTYTSKFLLYYWNNLKYEMIKTIFYLDGLDLFMETGRCYELPYESQSAFSPAERKNILRIFMGKCDSGQIVPILLKENSIKLAPELSIKTLNKQTPLFFWNPTDAPFSSCTLEESTIKEAFADFLEYVLVTPEFTYSQTESLELLHLHVEKYL